MHSTVQTGLFSQNLFSQQSSEHQYHNYSPSQAGNRYQPPAPHHHHHYHFQPPVSARHRPSTASRQDITSSMVAIDNQSGDGSSLAKSANLNHSSSNISKLPAFVFLSNSNLDKLNASNKNIYIESGGDKFKKQSSSSSSIIGQIVSSSNLTRNISNNFNEINLNGT